MSDLEVSKMNFKQLRNEVFELRDELAKFKRLFADSIENLDNDNFSSHILKEKENMKTEISVSADGIKTLVVKTDNLESGMTEMSSTIEQTAEKIETKVSKDELDGEIKKSSVITQLSDSIKTKVEKEDLTKELSKYSTIEQTEDSITSAVTEVNNDLKEAFESSIEQTKNSISMIVKANYGSPLEVTVFNKNTADTGVVYYESSTNLYWHYDGEKWQSGANGNFGSVFKQTANGFELDGKVKISGDLVSGGTITGAEIRANANNYNDGVVLYSNGGYAEFLQTGNPIAGWKSYDIIGGTQFGSVGNAKFCLNFDHFNVRTIKHDNSAVTDLTVSSLDNAAGRFYIDLSGSATDYKEIKFAGLSSTDDGIPLVYANEKLLATKEYVDSHGGGSGGVAVFG